MVHDALWAMAEASPRLEALVKVGNRVKFNQTRPGDPRKAEISNADTPELVLVPTSTTIQMHSTSSTSAAIRQFEWWLSTGSMSVTSRLLPFEFALFTAMLRWKEEIASLRWPTGAPYGFAKRMDVVSVVGGFADTEKNRGIAGWSSIWACEIEMHFPTDTLIAYTNEEIETGTGS